MKRQISAALVAAMLGLATVSAASAQPPAVGAEPGAAMLAITTLPAKADRKLVVTSPAFQNGADIPFENTSYRGNIFPGLAWTRGPYGTRSFAIVMQDDDAVYKGAAILHWTMYDIPGGVRSLPVGMPTMPPGSSYGPNIAGPRHAYMGPHTPPGPRHHYHIQVFALDETIAPTPIASYADLTAAMSGHVLASGQLVGLGRVDPNAPPHTAPPPPLPVAPPVH
jgi:para-nitrobenzyl esterase